jgi:hypothetical protein
VLGDYALQVQLANPLEQCDPAAVNVIDVSDRALHVHLRQQPPKFLLALYQLMGSQIFAVKRQEVEREEARRSAMEHEIVESRLAFAVKRNDLAIKNSIGR